MSRVKVYRQSPSFSSRAWRRGGGIRSARGGLALGGLAQGALEALALGLGALLASSTPVQAQDTPVAAPPPPPSVSIEDRAAGIHRDLKVARSESPPNARALEAICTAWQPRKLFEFEPSLRVELALCAAEAAFYAERENVLEKRLEEVLNLTAGDANTVAEIEFQARARTLRADVAKARYLKFERCGTDIGLVRLRKFEAEEMRRLVDLAVSHYRAVIGVGSPSAELNAVVEIAGLYDDFYRKAALKRPATYRGVALPSPFVVLSLGTKETLSESLSPTSSPWPREIRRLYDVAILAAKSQKETKTVATLVAARSALADDAALEQETASAPWKDAVPPGAIRSRRGKFEEKGPTGWTPLEKKTAIAQMETQIKARPMTALGAFALVGLAEAGLAPPVTVIEALQSDLPVVRFAALYAAELAPVTDYKAPLLDAWTRATNTRPPDPAPPYFSTLQDAMYGEPERVLLALQSLVTRERDVALDLTYMRVLPTDERAWLIAELGDTRTRYRVIELVQTGDLRTQAIALYGTYLSNGERALYMLRQYQSGLPGCVAKNTLGIHEERERRMAGIPLDDHGGE